MSNTLTVVRLLNVPLENDYKHTFYFNDKSEQLEYFQNVTPIKTMANCSYQRKDKFICVDACIDDIITANYVMYKNEAHSSKWYYAFIEKMEYKNDNRTDVYIKTDVLQTWLREYNFKSSYIEREHVKDDTVGLHTFPEQLETGDYIVNSRNANESLLVKTFILASTVDLNKEEDTLTGYKYPPVSGKLYNGIYSGVKYYKVTESQCNAIIVDLAKAGQSDAIISIFTCPSLFVSSTIPEGGFYPEVDASDDVIKKEWVNTFGIDEEQPLKPKKINGYVPNNNKLLCYPYSYMLMSNNAGGSAIYKYELFNHPENNEKCDFKIYSTLCAGMSIRLIPHYYNGSEYNIDEGLNLGKFPVCNWNTDVYTNWLTQNGVNIGLSLIGSTAQVGLGVGLGVASGGLGLAVSGENIASGVMGIASTLGEIYSHSKQPPQAEGNINSGDVTFSAGYLTFTAHHMSIKKEYAKIIDGFFDMYGYKVNEVKKPNVNHRAHYWFTKTIDCNIDGLIPMEDLQEIKNIYNKGVTFWRSPSRVGDYSLAESNIIVDQDIT